MIYFILVVKNNLLVVKNEQDKDRCTKQIREEG